VAFAVIGSAQVRYARYEVPLLPVLAVLAGGLVADDLLGVARGRLLVWGTAGAIALVLIACVYGAGLLDHRMLRELVTIDARAEALRVIERRVPPDGSVGLITEPWFHHPPVDYCNGGVALRDNPVWATYRRPVRELAVLGLDAEALRRELPDAVVLTGFEIDGPRREDDPELRAFVSALSEAGYRVAAGPTGLARAGQTRRPPAQDWLYPFARIEVWVRAEGAAHPAP